MRSIRRRYLASVVGCLLFALWASPAARGQFTPSEGLSSEEELAIAQQMKAEFFSESEAKEFAATYGSRAVDFLVNMLEVQQPPGVKGKVAFFLGKCGGEKALQAIVKVLEADMSAIMAKGEWKDPYFAMFGLGFTGTDMALQYLKKMATDEYWDKRATHPQVPQEGMDQGFTRRLFRQAALLAIACSDTPQALDILKDADNFAADLPELVSDARQQAQSRISGHEPNGAPK